MSGISALSPARMLVETRALARRAEAGKVSEVERREVTGGKVGGRMQKVEGNGESGWAAHSWRDWPAMVGMHRSVA